MTSDARRLDSVDALRGLTVAAMIVVNNPGNWSAVFSPLVHSAWNGCTFADVVFPGFIFIMGLAMPFAFEHRGRAGHGHGLLYRRIGRRVLLLILLGLLINAVSAPGLASIRIPGVLQRIALVYLIAAVVLMHVRSAAGRALVAVALLLGHWALLTLVPFGGHAAGTVTPMANVAAYLDLRVFGVHTLTPDGDPEGLLGTLPAAATALIGSLVGTFVRTQASEPGRTAGLVISGMGALAAGAVWSFWLPLNKPLWTASYALVTAGVATLAFAALHVLMDRLGWRRWARPLVWLGVNPLLVYFVSEIAGHLLDRTWLNRNGTPISPKTWLFWRYVDPAIGGSNGAWASLAFALALVAVLTTLAHLMHRRHLRVAV